MSSIVFGMFDGKWILFEYKLYISGLLRQCSIGFPYLDRNRNKSNLEGRNFLKIMEQIG